MKMKNWMGILLGAFLLASGVLYILKVLGYVGFSLSLDGWWTLFIILPCLNELLTGQNKAGSLVGLGVGALLLLAARGVWEYGKVCKLIVPLILVALGIKLIAGSLGTGERSDGLVAIFNKQGGSFPQGELSTGKIGAVFGGTECNLTNAQIVDGCHLELYCAFGGVELTLPENVIVKNNAFCLFGGISDKRPNQKVSGGDVALTIEGYCLFGGVDIK